MEIVVAHGRVWLFDDLPPRTIALDGTVAGPRVEPETERYSFDHHAGCIRLVTSATCQQVLDAIVLGLDPSDYTVLVNDLDGDTVLSVWLLREHRRWRDAEALARVRPLVASVGAADAHGPAYPAPSPDLLDHFHAAILAPLREKGVLAGGLPTRGTLDACLARLDSWWEAGLVPAARAVAPGAQPAIERHGSWSLVHLETAAAEAGSERVASLYRQGHDRLVLWSRKSDGRYRYTLAKRSDLVAGFPIDCLYAALNAAEARIRGVALGPSQTWGGGSSVGGSPRDGSVLGPQVVATAIEMAIGAIDSMRT